MPRIHVAQNIKTTALVLLILLALITSQGRAQACPTAALTGVEASL